MTNHGFKRQHVSLKQHEGSYWSNSSIRSIKIAGSFCRNSNCVL